MNKSHVATYHTRTGLLALAIEKVTRSDGTCYFCYTGKHGAGSGHALPDVRSTVRIMLSCHKGVRLADGIDILDPDEVIHCAHCRTLILLRDSWSPGDEALCSKCDTEVTGRTHDPSSDQSA